MNLKDEYKQLTSIDIEKQKSIWNDRGKGYYGEFLLFCELYSSIADGSKIIMNLNIPVNEYKTTELDLVLLHKTGIYVFEIKHYKGIIYGNDSDKMWTQYFITTKNSHFNSPILQNQYHIEHLKKLFPDIPIFSFIVFTNEDCTLKIDNSIDNVNICRLSDVKSDLFNHTKSCEEKYSMEQIDEMFKKLTPFSQMMTPVTIDDTEADFFTWIKPTIEKLEEKVVEAEAEKQKVIEHQKALKKTKITGIILYILIILATTFFAFFVSKIAIELKNEELNLFKQKFLHVDEIGNEYIDVLNSYVEISDVSLTPLTDDAVSFKARINRATDIYGITIEEDAKYIVLTESGQVFEYDMFGERLIYSSYSNTICKGVNNHGDLAEIQFYGISDVNDISYIKITGIKLFKTNSSHKTIKDNLEIELYSK